MVCPKNPPPPDGFRVWRKSVPTELAQWAVQLRDQWMPHANYGDTQALEYSSSSGGAPPTMQQVVARKDYHSWTFHGGRLITGICIPGITLYESLLTPAMSASPDVYDVSTPDPNAAVYSVDTDAAGNPIVPVDQGTAPDTGALVASGVALVAVIGLFVAAVTHRIR